MRFILSLFLLTSITLTSHGMTCKGVFRGHVSDPFLVAMEDKVKISETQLMKAAVKSVVSDRSLNQRGRRWALQYVEALRQNKNFRESIQIELQRRTYGRALEKMGVRVTKDPLYILERNKVTLSWILSLGLNGLVNYASYHYLGTAGVVISIPQMRMFDPRKIPDEMLHELMRSSEVGPVTRQYVTSRVKYGAQAILNNVGRLFNVGVLAVFLLYHHEALTDPQAYIEKQMQDTVVAISSIAVQQNLETIDRIKLRLEIFRVEGNTEKVNKAEALINKIESDNRRILSEQQSESSLEPMREL